MRLPREREKYRTRLNFSQAVDAQMKNHAQNFPFAEHYSARLDFFGQ